MFRIIRILGEKLCVSLHLKTIKFYFIKLVTDVLQPPSFLPVEISPLATGALSQE
jgi:hypothetical protein